MKSAWERRFLNTRKPELPSIEGVDTGLLERVCDALGPDGRKVVVFDADGTLWRGDIGDTHLRQLGSEGLASSFEGQPSAHRLYLEACQKDVEYGYRLGTQLLATLSEERAFASCESTWTAHKGELFSYARPLIEKLVELGAEVWIVSASHRWIIEVAVRDLGIPSERIIAGDLVCADGVLTDQIIEPFPNGQGKAEAIEARVGVAPRVAFGNSRHDFAMLECAQQAVLIWDETSNSESLRAEARTRGWHVVEGRVGRLT